MRAQHVGDSVGTRQRRRRRVMVVYGLWLVAAVVSEVLVQATSAKFFAVPILILTYAIAALGFWGLPSLIAREVLKSDTGLDERLVRNRLVAFRSAYRTLALYVIAAWAVSLGLVSASPNPTGFGTAFVLVMTGSFLATTLPTAWWMWQEPDPVDA